MDCQDYITESVERKKGQHLQREERGAIQHRKNAASTNIAIAIANGCSPTTVGNELKRGTPPRKSSKGRKPGYTARRGEAVYKANRKRSRKPHRICHCTRFIRWIMEQVKEHKWSLDACVGYARLHKLFSAEEMVCTHTLYNEVWAGSLDLSVTELPEAMKRKQHKDTKPREHKKSFGTDISQRPEIAALRIEEGHWEGDTVVGKRAGKEAVALSLLEKKTENYILHRCGANLLLERICVQIELPHLGERVSGCRGADLPPERLAEIFVHEPAFRAGKIIDTHQARPDALFAPVRNAEHLAPAL